MTTATEILLSAAVVGFALGWSIPFVARIVTQRSVAGVSPVMLVATVAANTGWLAVGVRGGEVALSASAIIYVLGCAVALVLGFRYRWRFTWWPAAAAVSVLLAAFALGGVGGVGVTVLGFAIVRFGAQVLAVWRADDVSGVSTAAWVVAGTEGLVWLVAYGGVFSWVWQAALWGAVALAASTAIVTRVRVVRARSAEGGPAPAVAVSGANR